MIPPASAKKDGDRDRDAALLDQAIAWAVRLESGTATGVERAGCTAWRAESPEHEQAWQQVQAVEQAFRGVPAGQGPLVLDVLRAAERVQSKGRRHLLKLLGSGAASIVLGVLVARFLPWQQRWVYASAVGNRRHVMLADGTRLQLNTDSDAEVVFSPLRRLIVLRRGEIFISTGRDADSLAGRRSFWVETAEARLEAIGTRFGVRQGSGETWLYVVEGSVAIHTPRTARPTIVEAGGAFVIRASEAAPVPVADRSFAPDGWADGVLVAKRMRLDAFLAELSRYRAAPLVCDPGVAEWHVSGVFQLDGADPVGRALDALTHTLPVRVVNGERGALLVARR